MADLRDQESLADLVAICRPLSESGLEAVIDCAISLYMDEQGITKEDVRKLQVKRERISAEFMAATFAPRDPGFDGFLTSVLEPVRKRRGRHRKGSAPGGVQRR